MEFCPEDGALMVPKNTDGKIVLTCPVCNHTSKKKEAGVIKEKVEKTETLEIHKSSEELDALPKVEQECPKCGHNEAAYWQEQTRSSDEPPTKFFKCTKCKATWRDYN